MAISSNLCDQPIFICSSDPKELVSQFGDELKKLSEKSALQYRELFKNELEEIAERVNILIEKLPRRKKRQPTNDDLLDEAHEDDNEDIDDEDIQDNPNLMCLFQEKETLTRVGLELEKYCDYLPVFGFNSSKYDLNTQDSSDDLNEHVASVTNVSTDASNLERINRWNCAIRMYAERPFLGHGPGTYMFLYAPYQKPSEKTIISTNGGNRGNAHSEYLGPLAESGTFGLLTFMGIIITVIVVSVNSYQRLDNDRLKGLLRVAFLGLITYYLHGFLNNFLDMDKASAPFWGFTAMISCLSLVSRRSEGVKGA